MIVRTVCRISIRQNREGGEASRFHGMVYRCSASYDFHDLSDCLAVSHVSDNSIFQPQNQNTLSSGHKRNTSGVERLGFHDCFTIQYVSQHVCSWYDTFDDMFHDMFVH